jgi:hypothetical protein
MCIAGTELNISSTADIYYLSNYYNSSVLDNSSIVFKVKREHGAKMFNRKLFCLIQYVVYQIYHTLVIKE